MPRTIPQRLTREQLLNVATEMERDAAAIRARVELLEEDSIESLEVTNYDQASRALRYLANFEVAIRKAHLDDREKSGAYKTEQRPKARKKKSS